jgi:16S rRNA (guanine966-N2)-methyltransferase
MRIVGGRLRGRALEGPRAGSQAIRPTSDRLRESLFNILLHGDFIPEGTQGAARDPVTDARVLDLFAGTGALGFEAVSRGANFALLVDEGEEARAIMRQNQSQLGLAGSTRIFRRDAVKLGVMTGLEPFSLVFCDPPYRKNLGEAALQSALAGGWLKPSAVIVLEEASDTEARLPKGFTELDRRRYGETQIIIGSAP